MSGISRFYYVGGAGGFLGSDGLNGVDFTVEVWETSIRTLRVIYHGDYLKPISDNFDSFVPNGPYDENQEREMMILFASNLFAECPSYNLVKEECKDIKSMDLSSGHNVPLHFHDLLEESKKIDISDKTHIYVSNLKEINI